MEAEKSTTQAQPPCSSSFIDGDQELGKQQLISQGTVEVVNEENDHLYFFASLDEPETLPLHIGNHAQIEGKGKIVTITNENMFVKTGNSNRKKVYGKNCEWEGVESIMVLRV